MKSRQPWRNLHGWPGTQVRGNQQRASRNGRQDVSRQLGLRSAEEQNRHQQPDQEKQLPRTRGRRTRFLFLGPDQAQALRQNEDQPNCPRHQTQQQYGQVEPKRLTMVIQVLSEAAKIMFKDKYSK